MNADEIREALAAASARAAEKSEFVYTREDMARAWWQGHMTYRRLGPDNCKCAAWNESECGCGEYGSNVITPNPYSAPAPAGGDA